MVTQLLLFVIVVASNTISNCYAATLVSETQIVEGPGDINDSYGFCIGFNDNWVVATGVGEGKVYFYSRDGSGTVVEPYDTVFDDSGFQGAHCHMSFPTTDTVTRAVFGPAQGTQGTEVWSDDGGWSLEYLFPTANWGNCPNINSPCHAVHMNAEGDRLIVGDPTGKAIHIQSRSGTTWSAMTGGDNTQSSINYFGEYVYMNPVGDRAAACGFYGATDGCVVYSYDGSTWTASSVLTKPAAFSQFGASVAMSNDGSRVYIGTNLGITVWEEGPVGTWTENLSKRDNAYNTQPTSMSVDSVTEQLFVGFININVECTACGAVYVYYTDQNGDLVSPGYLHVVSPQNDGDKLGRGVMANNNEVFASTRDWNAATQSLGGMFARWIVNGPPTPSPTPAPTPAPTPPQCVVSADCTNNFYCKGTSCIDPAPCTVHNDCAGAFNAGRLPYCAPSGFCKDVAASTCSTVTLCNIAADKFTTNSKSIGSLKQDVSAIANSVTRLTAAKSLITNLKTAKTVAAPMVVSVKGEETVTMVTGLYEGLNSSAVETELAKLKAVRCADAADYCTVSITGNSRRILGEGRELAQSVVVTIVYDVPDDIFDQIQNSTSFDDPDFLADLAAASGVDPSEISVFATGGTLVIEFTLTDESGDDTLTDETVFDDITSLQGSLSTVTSTVVGELNLTASDILTEDLDLCGDRTCGGFGAELCDVGTGVCDCPVGYLGINCDVSLNCGANGDIVTGTSYCACDYPYYGFKCHLNRTCSELC